MGRQCVHIKHAAQHNAVQEQKSGTRHMQQRPGTYLANPKTHNWYLSGKSMQIFPLLFWFKGYRIIETHALVLYNEVKVVSLTLDVEQNWWPFCFKVEESGKRSVATLTFFVCGKLHN